uniref:Uncharacterized protein n=1 Tax=Romanomermis culicivorax TaxID=13658 RepID=A0A915I9X9_ROMCU
MGIANQRQRPAFLPDDISANIVCMMPNRRGGIGCKNLTGAKTAGAETAAAKVVALKRLFPMRKCY